jgi:hypothetical protein
MDQLSLKNNRFNFKNSRKLWGIHRIFSHLGEKNQKMSTCNQPVGLGNTRISTDSAQISSPRGTAGSDSGHCIVSLQWPDKQEIGRWQVPKCPSRPNKATINGSSIYMPAPGAVKSVIYDPQNACLNLCLRCALRVSPLQGQCDLNSQLPRPFPK